MGGLKKYYFGKSKLKPNLFIGGVASVVSTPAILATKLGISESNIKVFSIVGSDIQCHVKVSYTVQIDSFTSMPEITFYNDYGGKCVSVNRSFRNSVNLEWANFPNATSLVSATQGSFTNCTALKYVKAPKLTSIGSQALEGCTSLIGENLDGIIYYPLVTSLGHNALHGCTLVIEINLPELLTTLYAICNGCTLLKRFIAPKATSLGLTSIDRFTNGTSLELVDIPKCKEIGAPNGASNFTNIKTGCVVNVDSFMQTCNAGAPDLDLTYVVSSRGGTVNYITN